MKIVFVTGIDTGVGKTLATGWLARAWLREGRRVLTAKLVQTGCTGMAEDICVHRACMGLPLQPADLRGDTCPYVFAFPAAPQLSAELQRMQVDPGRLDRAWDALAGECDLLVLEGVGGVAVPLTSEGTTLDYLAERAWPCLVVTSPRLGSVNHTLLTLDALERRRVPVAGLVYNLAGEAPGEIIEGTRKYLQARYAGIPWLEIPRWTPGEVAPDLDVRGIRL